MIHTTRTYYGFLDILAFMELFTCLLRLERTFMKSRQRSKSVSWKTLKSLAVIYLSQREFHFAYHFTHWMWETFGYHIVEMTLKYKFDTRQFLCLSLSHLLKPLTTQHIRGVMLSHWSLGALCVAFKWLKIWLISTFWTQEQNTLSLENAEAQNNTFFLLANENYSQRKSVSTEPHM